jgi:sortase A
MPTDDDNQDDLANLKPKKEKVIQPLSSDQYKSGVSIPGASDDLLAELREKTARLAEQVHGKESRHSSVLDISNEADQDEAVIEALKQNRPDKPKPADPADNEATKNPALELVRSKLSRIYKNEPEAATEALEVTQIKKHRSPHQQFMYELTTSGKSLADIQTEWHNYYVALPDNEKHQVWQEFYELQGQTSKYAIAQQKPTHEPEKTQENKPKTRKHKIAPLKPPDARTVTQVKNQLLDKISAGGQLTAVQHAKSLLFGLGLATLVGLIVTFTLFNEVFIAPFISPAKSISTTPIIGNQTGQVGPESKIIIPKINLEVPVVFGMNSVEEKNVQKALEDGVVHYATTPNPGEIGNAVIVGHSSNNILNSGKYKFAFVLLKRLEVDDTFFVQKDGIRYTYKVFRKPEVVGPDDISVLETQEKPNTITLITCDPPGTSINRLIVVAEQISPDPNANKQSTAINLDTQQIEELPSNAPSLWSRIWPF